MQTEYRTVPDTDLETGSTWLSIRSEYGFAVSTAECGDMGPSGLPAANREHVLRSIGYDPESVLGVRQTHSRDIADFYSVTPGTEPRTFSDPAYGFEGRVVAGVPGGAGVASVAGAAGGTDAAGLSGAAGVADAAGVAADGILFDPTVHAAGVTVADCLPVLLVADDAPVAALVHSGFRGTGIVSVALKAMRELAGVEAGRVTAALGPCISGECYAVPRERAERFRNAFGAQCAWHEGGQSYLDMRAANLSLLEEWGVQRVTVMDVCTHCDPRLGSYRRDGANFFRMLAIAGPFRK